METITCNGITKLVFMQNGVPMVETSKGQIISAELWKTRQEFLGLGLKPTESIKRTSRWKLTVAGDWVKRSCARKDNLEMEARAEQA